MPRLRLRVDEVSGTVDVTIYERRENGAVVVFDPREAADISVAPGSEAPISFRTSEQRLAEVLLDCGKEIAF